MPITLVGLFAGMKCSGLKCEHEPIIIRSVVTAPGEAEPGSLFVALFGQCTQGIPTRDGCRSEEALFLTSDTFPNPIRSRLNDVAWITAIRPRHLLSELAARLYGFPPKHPRRDRDQRQSHGTLHAEPYIKIPRSLHRLLDYQQF
ncbi:MAG: hypothetical protein C7B43_19050 [Sulfobacillus benefaciens]|uniref:Uncharacterized protein n=1 Tax=Sulfobacillus benefaciens TaxID=453960 RepID=A0A2T2WQD2_9FIRM|nr:MAG: hypothetical protein C7B43_19050 [Sulfobacillus benefaciens]